MVPEKKAEVVVITGGTAGIGRATARAFSKNGARVAVLARGRDGLDSTVRELEEAGGCALGIPVDVADADQVELAAAEVERELGPIDIWVNNAMTSVFSPVKEMKALEYKRVTEVTYLGYVYGTLAALRRMLPRDHGMIIQVGSALAHRSVPLQSAYCGAKHAIQGFTESLLSELLHDKSNVRVTVIDLPAMNTPQFGWVKSRLPRKPQPVPPIFQPEVAANAIVWAAHQRRREVYVGAPAASAIEGNKISPWLLDRYLARFGYETQQTSELADPNAMNNLWVPVPGDHGAHGTFDSHAHARSAHLWLTMHRRGVALTTVAAALGILLFRLAR